MGSGGWQHADGSRWGPGMGRFGRSFGLRPAGGRSKSPGGYARNGYGRYSSARMSGRKRGKRSTMHMDPGAGISGRLTGRAAGSNGSAVSCRRRNGLLWRFGSCGGARAPAIRRGEPGSAAARRVRRRVRNRPEAARASRAGRRCSSRYSRYGVSTSSIHFMNARTRRDRLLLCATTRDTAIARRRKSGMISTSAPLSKYWPIPKSGA